MTGEQSPVRSPLPGCLEDPAPEPSQPPSSPQRDPKDAGDKRQNAEGTSSTAASLAKRPRYNDKAFGDLSVNDLEGIVKEALAYKKACATQEAELALLKDVRTERAAMAKRIKALEGELASAQKEAERSRSAIQEQGASLAEQAERVKLALRRSLTQQMVFHPGMKDKLQGEGREIVAFAANVSPEILKELGAKPGSVTKYADSFFSGELSRSNQGMKMVLARSLVMKYVKTTCELRVDATYMLEGAKKKPTVGVTKKPKKKARGAAKKSVKDAAEDGEDDDADEDEEEDGGEEAGEDDAEEMEVEVAQPAAA